MKTNKKNKYLTIGEAKKLIKKHRKNTELGFAKLFDIDGNELGLTKHGEIVKNVAYKLYWKDGNATASVNANDIDDLRVADMFSCPVEKQILDLPSKDDNKILKVYRLVDGQMPSVLAIKKIALTNWYDSDCNENFKVLKLTGEFIDSLRVAEIEESARVSHGAYLYSK